MRSVSVVGLAVACLCFGCQDSGGSEAAGGEGGAGGAAAPSLEILGVVTPDAECRYSIDLSRSLEEGSWDLASPDDYLVGLLVENLLESEIVDELQGELNTVQVGQIHVTLLRPDGTPLELDGPPNPYVTVTSGVVPPMGTEQPARSTVVAIGVPSTFASALADAGLEDLTLKLEAHGTTTGGNDARSRSVLLTVRLCEECLLEACSGSEPPGGACTPGQDGEPWCRP